MGWFIAAVAADLPAASPAGWERRASMPVPGAGFVSGVFDREIFIAGGTNWHRGVKQWLNQIWAYDPRLNTWREGGALDVPIGYAAAAQEGRTLWFAGGSGGTATHRTGWMMAAPGVVRPAFRLETGVVYACGAIVGDALYIIGGSDDHARLEAVSRSCVAVSLQTGAVRRLADYPVPLAIGAAVAVGGRIYVFGGMYWDSAGGRVVNHASAFVYSPEDDRWVALPSMAAANRGLAALRLDEGHILLAGGYTDEFTAAAYRFDTESRHYTPVEPLPYAAASVGLLASDGWVYCMGGEDRMQHRTDAVFRRRVDRMLPAGR